MTYPLRAAPLFALLAAAACGDKDADSGAPAAYDTGPPAQIDYTADIEPILTGECASCHDADGSFEPAAKLGLNLEAGAAYDSLVGADSAQLPGVARVAPGDTDASYLWHKLNDTHTTVGGSGDKMPPAYLLVQEDRDAIGSWIQAGAQR